MTEAAWIPDPLDGAELLDDVEAFLGRFVAFPSDAARVAVALWAAHAHAVTAFDSTPRLALLSPEPGSGKTRTLEMLELLVPEPMPALSASPAAVFRTIEAEQPTLLLDEVDAVFRRRGSDDSAEDLRALLNAGHRKGAAIPRCVGPSHEVRRFPVFAAVALAGLGDLPDTLMSRSVIVRMRRRAPHERIEPFRHRRHASTGHELRTRLADWIATVTETLTDAWPAMPVGVEDRPADCWEPLLAVADAAGGAWPDRARGACVELVKVAESREASLGVRLLADLRDIFDEDRLDTETVLDRLHALDESPWADLRGRPLDTRGLTRRLRPYGVARVSVRIGERVAKGYRREDLHETWARYLRPPDPPTPSTPSTSVTAQVSDPADVEAGPGVAATSGESSTAGEPLTSHVEGVDGVDGSQTWPDLFTATDSDVEEVARWS